MTGSILLNIIAACAALGGLALAVRCSLSIGGGSDRQRAASRALHASPVTLPGRELDERRAA
jgi:hypothetical protein